MSVHISGMCKFKNCDKPSIIEGFCTFHYNLVNQQKSNLVLSELVSIMKNVYEKLDDIENKFDNLQPVTTSVSKNPNQTITKKREIESSSVFIPKIDLPDNEININNLKTEQTKRDIRKIANQLNTMDISDE